MRVDVYYATCQSQVKKEDKKTYYIDNPKEISFHQRKIIEISLLNSLKDFPKRLAK